MASVQPVDNANRLITPRGGATSTAAGESQGISSIPNLRDVGGYLTAEGHRVRTGLLYRVECPEPSGG